MSIAIEEMPNYFIFNGPYNCGGNGCAVPPIEVEGDYSKEALRCDVYWLTNVSPCPQ
jgi:hypothetical protein